MLPPVITHTTFFPASRARDFGGGQRCRAGWFSEVVRQPQRRADAFPELLLLERHDIVELLT